MNLVFIYFKACEGDDDNKCNCDVNDYTWRSDEGYLTDTTKLPVSELRLGDIDGDRELGFYTLGSLQCFGKSKST